ARRAGVLARCAVLRTTNRSRFGRVRVAQANMARRARGEFQTRVYNGHLRVAQSIWRGALASVLKEIKEFQKWNRGL
ncbi:hypothetical protein A2U01_0091935, partial [Trifolium medium]|nr:hypothetical protein [Trifolium medium]